MEHDGPADWEAHEPQFGPDEEALGASFDGADGADDAGGDHDVAADELPDDEGPDGGLDSPADDPLAAHPFGGHEENPDTGGLGLEFSDLSEDAGQDPEASGQSEEYHLDDPVGVETEPVPGTDPDRDPVGDDPYWSTDDPFPPRLDLGETPEPVDGFPWSDPAVLGEYHDTGDAEQGPERQSPPPDDLLAYDAHDLPPGTDPWQALASSEDPATSSLARWWGPGT